MITVAPVPGKYALASAGAEGEGFDQGQILVCHTQRSSCVANHVMMCEVTWFGGAEFDHVVTAQILFAA